MKVCRLKPLQHDNQWGNKQEEHKVTSSLRDNTKIEWISDEWLEDECSDIGRSRNGKGTEGGRRGGRGGGEGGIMIVIRSMGKRNHRIEDR